MVLAFFVAVWLQAPKPPEGFKFVQTAGVQVAVPLKAVQRKAEMQVNDEIHSSTWKSPTELFTITVIPPDKSVKNNPPEKLAAMFISEVLTDAPSDIQKEEDALYDGWPGLTAWLKATTVRVFIIGDKTYQLDVEPVRGKVDPAHCKTFFDSFTVSPLPPAGPQTVAGVDLQPFDLPGDRAHLRFPAKHDQALGGPASSTVFMAEYGQRRYLIGSAVLPSTGDADAIDSAMIGGMTARLKLKLISSTKRHTTDGRDVTTGFYRNAKTDAKFEWSHKDHVTYFMGIFYPPYLKDLPELTTFFDSLKVDDAPKQ